MKPISASPRASDQRTTPSRCLQFRRPLFFSAAGLVASLAILLSGTANVTAQDPPADAAAAVAAVEAETKSDQAAARAVTRERRRKAIIGFLALAAIAITGVALLAVVIIWAGRLRRMNREPLPAAPLRDELWFLRPSKSSTDALRPGGQPPPSRDAE